MRQFCKFSLKFRVLEFSLNDIQGLTIFLRSDEVRKFLSYAPPQLSACLIIQRKLHPNLADVQSVPFGHSLNSVPEAEVVVCVQTFERSCPFPIRYLNVVNLERFFVKFRFEVSGCSAPDTAK